MREEVLLLLEVLYEILLRLVLGELLDLIHKILLRRVGGLVVIIVAWSKIWSRLYNRTLQINILRGYKCATLTL
jgi:hypothetical protein